MRPSVNDSIVLITGNVDWEKKENVILVKQQVCV